MVASRSATNSPFKFIAPKATASRWSKLTLNQAAQHQIKRSLSTPAGLERVEALMREDGWLGAAGIAASALQLAARDRWIGWDAAGRRSHLHRVVGLSRFLIRPGVVCRNLASHVLGQLLRRLPADFEARYGYAPYLVETFVDGTHRGASLRAANWRLLGETAGRGRQDRHNAAAAGRKRVYVYELAVDWRRRLGVGAAPVLPSDALAPGDGLDGAVWAANEFGGAPLGDARLSARLVATAALMGADPMASLPAAAKGERAQIKGYYRFVDQPDAAATTPDNILRPHRERTLQRMRSEPTVLCVQDGTDLNFATRPGCDGLGVIGANQTGAQSLGLHLHSTLAVTPAGLPLGVLNARFVAPAPKAADRDEAHDKPPQERKSARWIEGFRDCADLARELGPGRLVCVMDREADDLRLFEEQRARPQADLLVRVKGRRRVAGGRSLLDALRAPVARAAVPLWRRTPTPSNSRPPVANTAASRRCACRACWSRSNAPPKAPRQSAGCCSPPSPPTRPRPAGASSNTTPAAGASRTGIASSSPAARLRNSPTAAPRAWPAPPPSTSSSPGASSS